MYYPLHLGVTEAGEGEDGRIKISCRYRNITEDGIGDTIRVSLTEDPEFEILWRWIWFQDILIVINCNLLFLLWKIKAKRNRISLIRWRVNSFPSVKIRVTCNQSPDSKYPAALFSYEYNRRYSEKFWISEVTKYHGLLQTLVTKTNLLRLHFFLLVITIQSLPINGIWVIRACDFIYTGNKCVEFELPGTLGIIVDAKVWANNKTNKGIIHCKLQ